MYINWKFYANYIVSKTKEEKIHNNLFAVASWSEWILSFLAVDAMKQSNLLCYAYKLINLRLAKEESADAT